MIGISNSLRHELGLQGISTKRVEVQLSPQNEYDFMVLCVRLCKEFETDIKLKKVAKRISLNEYVARVLPKMLGGRKEEIETKINNFLGLLDLWSQSQVIELYKWIFDINPRINTVVIHNQIIDRFKHLDPEFNDSIRKSLKNVSFPFKDMIDVVGKFIHDKSLRVFIENVEAGQRIKRGGIQDRKVPAILLIKAALEAEYEVGSRQTREEPESSKAETKFSYNNDKRNYVIKPRDDSPQRQTQQQPSLEQKLENGFFTEDDLAEIPDIDHIFDDLEPGYKKSSLQDLTKIAHKYVFGHHDTLDDVKQAINKNKDALEEENMSTNSLLAKDIAALEAKHQAAVARHEEMDSLYSLALRLFTDHKQNYYTLGKEISIVAKLTDFLAEFYETNPDHMKLLKGVKQQDVMDLKRLKLLIGKCFEKTSEDALYDFQRVFKFAIDYEDYENDILKGGDKRDQVFELLQKSPPVPDQKGLRNVRAKMRELKEFDVDSPVRDRFHKSSHREEVEGNDLLMKSAYYHDSKAFQSRTDKLEPTRQELALEEDVLLGYRIPSSILDGMTKLLINKFYKPLIDDGSKKDGAKRKDSKVSSVSSGSKKSKKSGKSSTKKKNGGSTSRGKSPKSARSSSAKLSKASKSAKKSPKKRGKSTKRSASASPDKKSSKSPASRQSRTPSAKSKSAKGTKKPVGAKKRTKKSKKVKKAAPETKSPAEKLIRKSSLDDRDAPKTNSEKLLSQLDESPSPKKRKVWKEDDPIFRSRDTSINKSVDPELDDLISNRHSRSSRSKSPAMTSPVLVVEPTSVNENLFANSTSRVADTAKSSGKKVSGVKKSPSRSKSKKKTAKKDASGKTLKSRNGSKSVKKTSDKSVKKTGVAKKTGEKSKTPLKASATNKATAGSKVVGAPKPKTTLATGTND